MNFRYLPLVILCVMLRGADYYVDCGGGNDRASGLSPSNAWGSLGKVNETRLQPGDRVFLKRGVTCKGSLVPQGSGLPAQPILLDAYGDGALPVVDAAGAAVAIRLENQEHWHISRVAATGSTEYGIFLGASDRVVHDLRLTDVQAWGVHGPLKQKASGLIVAKASGTGLFQGLLIDGATVWNTTQWSGIMVDGVAWSNPPAEQRSTGVVIRNSIAHDVWGDGIVLFQAAGGVIERSAAWNTGMQPTQTIGTPCGMWTWRCRGCQLRDSESYYSDSPGVDGGSFDVDWGNDDNVFENNYGHDSQAYCISVFGAENLVTTNSVIRNNLCVDNNRSPRLAKHHGGIHLFTWNGGKLDGVTITGNTVVWNPPVNAPLLRNDAQFTGTRANTVENNSFIASRGEMALSAGSLRFHANRYQVRHGVPEWTEEDRRSVGLSAWQGRGQDAGSTIEKSLPDPLGGPFVPAPIPARLRAAGIDLSAFKGRYALIALLPDSPDARGLAVHLNSAQFQYAAKGLAVVAALPGSQRERENKARDWALHGIEVAPLVPGEDRAAKRRDPRTSAKRAAATTLTEAPVTYLVDPSGNLLRAWEGYRPAKEILAAVRAVLGPPAGVAAEVGQHH